MKICNQCGKEVPDRAKFCPNCGMTFDLPNPEPEAQPANPPVPEAGVTTVLYRPDLQTPPEAAQTPPPAQNPEPVQNPYAGQRQPSYGNPNPYAGQNQPAYGNPNPYAAQNQAPYGSPNPYAGQNQAPYGGQNPYGGQQPIYANPGWQQPAPSSPLTRTGNPVMEAIRRCGASGLTLLAALLVTAPLLYSIIYEIIQIPKTYATSPGMLISTIYSLRVLPNDINKAILDMCTDETLRYVLIFLKNLPEILIALALWAICAGMHGKREPVPTGGLTTAKLAVFIKLFITCVIGGMLLYSLISSYVKVADMLKYAGSYGEKVTTQFITLTAIVVVGMVIMIIFYAKALQSLNAAKDACHGSASNRFSSYVSVMLVIYAILNVALIVAGFFQEDIAKELLKDGDFIPTLIVSIIPIYPEKFVDMLPILVPMVCAVFTSILFACLIGRARREVGAAAASQMRY